MSYLNDPFAPVMGIGSRPRLFVRVAGQVMLNAVSAEIISNNYFQADRIDLKLVSQLWISNMSPSWWVNQPKPVLIDIYLAELADDSQDPTTAGGSLATQPVLPAPQNAFHVFSGQIDRLSWKAETGLMTITGRDLSSLMIDTKTELAYPNQTSSQIATTIAQKHNLTPVVKATTTKVGRYYDQQHMLITIGQFSRATTEWDLLVFLARLEGFAVWMDGRNLHFEPESNYDNLPHYLVEFVSGNGLDFDRCNVQDLEIDWALNLAKDVRVVVKTFNTEHEAAYVRSFGKSAGTTGQSVVQTYEIFRPGLSSDQAQQLAEQTYNEIVAHERIATFKMPGELTLTPRYRVQIQGTNTGANGFDQLYYIDEIRRVISFDGGFVQHLRVKNHSPQSQVNVS
jgi:hypothetical protein